MARRVPKSVVPLTGRWRIVEMSGWDRDAIDLVEPGFIEFAGDGRGQFGFVAVRGWLDCRPVEQEGDQVSGRGWASLVNGETIEGRVFFHLGDDSSFRAKPPAADDRVDG